MEKESSGKGQIKKKISADPVLRKIMDLLKLQGKTERSLLDAVHVSKNMFTLWKSGRSTSYRDHLDEIAVFLDVPVELLARETNDVIDPRSMTLEEMHLVQVYRGLGRERKTLLMNTAELFHETGKEARNPSPVS